MSEQLALTLPARTWNTRWVEWARSLGMTPEQATDHCVQPSGNWSCHEFMGWVGERWREWERLTGRPAPHGRADHIAFDAWLASNTYPVAVASDAHPMRQSAPSRVNNAERAPAEGAE